MAVLLRCCWCAAEVILVAAGVLVQCAGCSSDTAVDVRLVLLLLLLLLLCCLCAYAVLLVVLLTRKKSS
jgi:hypothetical protein